MSSQKIQKIAICGGGIGGLTLAAAISKNCNTLIDIYEAKPVISTIGAGIAIWKRSWQVLQDLGLEAEITKRKLPLPKEGEARGPIFRKAGQPEPGFDFHSHMMPYGPTSLPRPILLDMLQALLSDKCKIHTSKHLTEYRVEASGSITLAFSDGETATADVLIGADGVHSLTRATMYKALSSANPNAGYEKFIEPIWSGTHAYRCTVDLPKFKELYPDHLAISQPRIWCGKNKHVVSHPYGTIINLVCFYTVETGEGTPYDGPWVTDVSTEEVIHAYDGFEPDLLLLLKYLEKPSRWAIHVTRPLPFSVSGRVALLGDSAHAMTPHQGVGGGQAIDDAHILGHLLAHPKARVENIEQILQVYQEVRLPLAAKAAERSRVNGQIYDFIHPDYPVKEDATASDLKVLGEVIGESFAWLGQGGCDEDWKRAQALFLAKCDS